MSKVICDVCGTAYAETATQCPICGSAKASANQTEAGAEQGTQPTAGYTYVKGGRFSKSNVRKRNKKAKTAERRSAPDRQPQKNANDDKANKWLVAVVVVLLLAIVAVIIYIAVRILGPSVGPGSNTKPSGTGSEPTGQTQESTLPEVPCTGFEPINKLIELSNPGDSYTLVVKPIPADTTDKIIMKSADETVATVSENGNVVAVGSGETVITVTCGGVTEECTVVCRFGDATDPTTPTVPVVIEFNTPFKDETTGKYDTTLDKKGQVWKAYNGSISPLEITWVSDDPNVCTIVNGVVTAVGRGQTEVHAQYKGTTVSCIVRCSFPADPEPTQPTEPADPNAPTEPTQPTEPPVRISHEDVMLSIGEKFTLTLKKGVDLLEVEWKADKEGIVTIEGNKITGLAANLVGTNVSATYEGETYTCIVRVKQG